MLQLLAGAGLAQCVPGPGGIRGCRGLVLRRRRREGGEQTSDSEADARLGNEAWRRNASSLRSGRFCSEVRAYIVACAKSYFSDNK
jgi:hypothetical protein